MVLRIAGYKLSREEARKWAMKTGGYEYNGEEGVYESAMIARWFRTTPRMREVFPAVESYQWPQPKHPTDEGPPVVVFLKRYSTYNSHLELVETREDKFLKNWLLDNGLRGIVDDLEFLIINDPDLDEFERKYGVPAPSPPETIGIRKGLYNIIRLPMPGEIKPLNCDDLFAKLEAAKAKWRVEDQQQAAMGAGEENWPIYDR